MMSTIALLTLVCAIIVPGTSMADPDACHDVAVVGAGVGGAYTAWRLRNHGLRVGLYEFSDRLGGRLYTHTFPQAPDIPVEIGAMRFNQEKHPVLYRTVHDVGLKTELFHLTDDILFYLRGKHLRNEDLKGDSVPYNLRPHERLGIDKMWRYLIQHTNFSGNIFSLDQEWPFVVSEDGVRLGNQTFQEFIRKYLSGEAVELISNVIKYSVHNVSAALLLHLMVTKDIGHRYDWLTISGGMQQLPVRLVEQFLSVSTKHHLHLNHQLVGITRETGGTYSLKFVIAQTVDGETSPNNHTVIVCSRKLILTVPTLALLQINWIMLQKRHIRLNLKTLNPQFAVKLYLVYDYPWWSDIRGKFDTLRDKLNRHDYPQNCPNPATQYSCWPKPTKQQSVCCPNPVTPHSVFRSDTTKRGRGASFNSDLLLDRTFDLGVSKTTGAAVLLVAYSVHDEWLELQKHGDQMWARNCSVSTEVIRHAHRYLARLYDMPVSTIPVPVDGVMSHWDDYPYGGPYSMWKIGIDWRQVWSTLHKPSAVDDIFLASGSYWDYDSDIWAENCLEAIDEIINSYF